METPVTKVVDSSLRKVGQVLAGGHLPSIARAVFSVSALRELLVDKFISHINDECATMCRKSGNAPSLFRTFPVDKVDSFSLEKCIDEVKVKAPTLFKLLYFLVTRSDYRNKTKRGNKHHPGICMALSVLLKERNRELSGLQTFLSLVLFSTRVNRKVCVCVCTRYMYNAIMIRDNKENNVCANF